MNRRQFLAAAASAVAGATGLAGYARYIEPRQVRLERLDFPVPNLPAHLDGFTIGVLADLHTGPLVPADWVRSVATRLAALKPDVVVIAGDMTGDVSPAEAHRLIDETLAPVRGAYGVVGNWDYFQLTPPMGVKPQSTVKLLVNQGVQVKPGLWLAGLDEGVFREPDVDRALAGAPPDSVRILVAHEPDLADRVEPRHHVALMIAGHTHGGQIRLPFVGPLLLPPLGRHYVAGLRQAPACAVYVSRGLGVTQAPVRFLSPPEVTLITLRRKA